jgi:hypothetical protein
MAGIDLPPERIHSTTVSGEPKSRVLARLAEQHPGAASYVFVEDKFSTLEKVGEGGVGSWPAAGFKGVSLECHSPVPSGRPGRERPAENAGVLIAAGWGLVVLQACMLASRGPAARVPWDRPVSKPPHNGSADARLQVIKAPETAGKWRLFLVDWGYNTPPERQQAADNPGIELVGVQQFADLMAGTL